MWVKLFGAAVLLVCSTAVGISLGLRVRARRDVLSRYSRFIEALADDIRRGRSMQSIFSDPDTEGLVCFNGLDFILPQGDLSARDSTLLEEFFRGLGMGDTQSQVKRCVIYAELLKKQEQEAAEQARVKGPLYGRLGFFAGLFMAVLII